MEKDSLTAGDHHGSTYYQHVQFLKVVRGQAHSQVTHTDGAAAVRMGMVAQDSARTGRTIVPD